MLVDFEGFPTYGGMAGYSMEALAQGIRECIDDNWIAYRIGDTGKVVAWAPTNKSHPALRSRR